MVYAGPHADSAAPELTDISVLVQEVVPHLRGPILRQAEIRTRLDSHLPAVWAKGLQIRQVVLNTIINAVEALEGKKGIVTIATGPVEIDGIRRGGQSLELPEGRYVKLEVSDTGNGMTEETQARVFDPYYTTKFLGRGLGLAVVQGIIRAHGGLITVRSKPGEGSTFEILLPVAR
jgi:signal transduction histidine kinase